MARQLYPDEFRAALSMSGALPESATVLELAQAGGIVWEEHALEFADYYHRQRLGPELQARGFAIPDELKAVIRKPKEGEVTDEVLAEYARTSGLYDAPGDQIKQFGAELAKAKENAGKKSPYFDSPNGG